MQTIKKEFAIYEIDNIVRYYKQNRENAKTKNKYDVLGILTQYNIKRNMDIMENAVESFVEFREEKENELNRNYFNEDKSFETMVKQVENGEEKEVPGRQVKEEYLEDFKKEQTKMLTELYKLASEKVTLELYPINLDDELPLLGNSHDTGLGMDDLNFLSIFK